MKHYILTILLVFSTLPLLAQDNNPRPDIEELLTVMRVEKLTQSAMAQVKGMMMNLAKQSGVPADDTDKIKTMQEKSFALIEQEMSWENMKPLYMKAYAETYSPDDVKQLLAFYKSPTGQMFLDKQPLLMQKTMDLTREKMTTLMPKLQKLVRDEAQAPANGAAPQNHRQAATRVLEDLRLLDSATDQYAIETNKVSGSKASFSDLKNYLKSGTRLYNTGADVFGVPYGPFTVDSIPKVSDSTFNALSDVADESFWSPYK